MVRAMRKILILGGLSGCAGGEKDGDEGVPIEEYACLHIAEGEIVDVALAREEARTIEVGREPYRVNLYPEEAGYVAFESPAQELVLLLDFAGAVPAVWTGEERTELEPGAPNPNCEVDLLEVIYLSVPEGQHWLELGPTYQANIWVMLGT
jgi:hypothetical protein